MQKTETCFGCRYFGHGSQCRRHAPVFMRWDLNGNNLGNPHIVEGVRWPGTTQTDWCGDFEQREQVQPPKGTVSL